MAFGTAIQTWNEHRYVEAFDLFEKHLAAFSEGPWAAETKLHLGCFCQYNGRFQESADWFEDILETTDEDTRMWHKARLRRSILHLDQGNLQESADGFAAMRKTDPDPKHQTYASYWIREIAFLKQHETAMRDCGQKALAHAARVMGQERDAQELLQLTAAGPHGFTATELHGTALIHGLNSQPVVATRALDVLPTPFVAHYTERHYVTVEEVSESQVRLYDNRVGGVTTMPRASFEKEWSGFALLFNTPPQTALILPATDLDAIVGGCCGLPRHPSDLGDDDDDCDKNCGMPGWSVNMVNMNFKLSDTPMWWDAPAGPPVFMSLLFNSLDSLQNYTMFGEKWSFAYSSWLLITPGSQVQVKDGDGNLETFTAPGGGGSYPITYTAPSGDFRELVETADHVFELRHQDGTIYHYAVPAAMSSSVPFLVSIEDRHANTIDITHNANGAITTVGHSSLPPADTWDLFYTQITLPDLTVVSRVERIEDPFGRACTFSYDANGHLTGQTDMGGIGYSYSYTIKPSESPEPDINGNYPVSNELLMETLTTPKGTTTIVTEPADGIQTAPGGSAVVAYPPYGDPMWSNYRIRVTDPEDFMQEFHFDGLDVEGFTRDGEQVARATVADPAKPWEWVGPKTEQLFTLTGGEGKVNSRKIKSPTGNVSLGSGSDYDPATQMPRTIVGPNGRTSWRSYNANGTLAYVRLPKSSNQPGTDYEIRFAYEPNGIDLKSVKRDLLGVEKTLGSLTYHANRDLHTVTDALGRTLTYVWHANGLPLSLTDSVTSDVITYHYEASWRQSETRLNGTVMMNTAYDLEGRLLSTFDTSSFLILYQYDDLNRLIRKDYPDDSFVEQIWECCYPSESRSGITVNGQDRVLQRTLTAHDGRGLPVKVTDTAGRVTRFEYDGRGAMKQLIDSRANASTWERDNAGRLVKKIYPDLTEEEWKWVKAVELDEYYNRRNQKTFYVYDFHGNVERRDVGAGFDTLYTYDTWDRLKQVNDYTHYNNWEAHDFDYDLIGRTTSIDGPWADDTIQWQYLDAQRKVIRTAPGNVVTEHVSGSLGRLSTILNPLGLFSNTYQGDSSQLAGVTHTLGNENGTAYAGFDTSFTYHDDTFRQALATITSSKPGGGTVGKHSYGYDSLGRISSWKREAPLANPSGPTQEFEWLLHYDHASQLSSVVQETLAGAISGGWHYSYDSAGNIASTQASPDTSSSAKMSLRSHNNLNQVDSYGGGGKALVRGSLSESGTVSVGVSGGGVRPARMLDGDRFEAEVELQAGSNSLDVEAMDHSGNRSSYNFGVSVGSQAAQTFSYDADGNLLSDGVRSYEWDSQSRLTKVTWTAGKTMEFRYNGLGQRAERIETDGGTVTRLYFLFDGVALVDRRSGSSDPDTALADRRYFSQGEQRKSGGVWKNYHYCRDHLGSVREVVDAGGSLMARYDFEPFGQRVVEYEASGYGESCDFGFTGHATLESPMASDSELILTQFRVYDPVMGRWLSPDPIGEAGGLNLYGYVGNNPVNLWDPLGLCIAINLFHDHDKIVDSGTVPRAYHTSMATAASNQINARRGRNLSDHYFYVAGHGNPFGIYDDYRGGTPHSALRVPVKDLANRIRSRPQYPKNCRKTVALLSCCTGKGGKSSYAQKLADELGTTVIAANGNLGFSAGISGAGSRLELEPGTRWIMFRPNANPQILPADYNPW